ncbi:XTP/dITP diphosphatase [Lederbergia graminis]|uniref:dITP/XTP pyrophosphatase n=1 Tax=Lederbergia graminis TaxID=735518 RepID=A0ABW0LP20_9BACI
MGRKVIIATKNKGKAKEFEALFSKFNLEVLTLLDIENAPDVEETGATFEENAVLKAEAISRFTRSIVVADDSGLVVDALDGRPGIYSARYAGEEKNDEANINKLLSELKDVQQEERTARFYCALAVAIPEEETLVVAGKCEGLIMNERRGTNGFGYDPVFYVPSLEQTMAELSSEQKNSISHRANALKNLQPLIERIFAKR